MRRFYALAAVALLAGIASAAPPHWVASWSAAQQIVEPENSIPQPLLRGATLRQVVRLSIGGAGFRLVLSNAFGTEPLRLAAVHVAPSLGSGAIDPARDRALTFSGRADVTIPAGAVYLSDPVMTPVAPMSDLSFSIRYDAPPVVETGHPGSRSTTYLSAGDHVADSQLPDAKPVGHWYQIAGVEVIAAPRSGAVAVLGDSIVDGRGSTTDGNDRWTNILALQLAPRGIAVLNAGLGGNRLLEDIKGPNGLARFDRDVIAQSGISAVIVSEGINDIGTLTIDQRTPPEEHVALVRRMIGVYEQMATRAHAHGLKAYITTIMPFMGNTYFHPDAANNADRTAVNIWIRRQKLFDGVIDFDAAMRDPLRPDHLNPAYDSGDMLHPGPGGYRVMGEAAAAAFLPAARPVLRTHIRTRRHRAR